MTLTLAIDVTAFVAAINRAARAVNALIENLVDPGGHRRQRARIERHLMICANRRKRCHKRGRR